MKRKPQILARIVVTHGMSIVPKSFDNALGWRAVTRYREAHYYFKSAHGHTCISLCGVVHVDRQLTDKISGIKCEECQNSHDVAIRPIKNIVEVLKKR